MWYSRLKAKACALAAITTLLLSPAFLQAQDNHPFNCGADQYWEEEAKKNPQLHRYRQEMLEKIIAQKSSGQKSGRAEKKIIPVVFHIIHTYGPENISKQKVLDQLRGLNEQYAAMNPDLSAVREMYKGVIGIPNIEFRLATKDPQGNCTDGIVRFYSPLTENARDNVKAESRWDTDKYLNIWVVSSINSFGGPGTVLGFAQFPWMTNTNTDGIVMRADQVSYNNETLAHEVGHYLGLLHTFEKYVGAGCGNPCASSGDLICDTPPSTDPSSGCPGETYNTCTLDNPDQPDMWENFMDYGSCQHMFTKGQTDQINAIFLEEPRRAKLITTANLIATGTDDNAVAVNCTPVADFYTPQNLACEGATISFKDNTFNGTPSAYLWTFEQGTPSTSNAKDPVIRFTKAGTYKVTLKTTNSSGSHEITKAGFIKILPAVSETKTPIAQSFEPFDPAGYEFTQDSKGLQWTVANKASASGYNSIWLNNSAGQFEESYKFTMPMVDMTTATESKLRFKIAYAQKNSSSRDELRVQVSTTCGQYFNNVYYKFGSALATAGSYHTGTFVPTAAQWRDVEVNLGSYATVKNLLIRFNLTNRGGNNIYIDDISVGGLLTGIEDNSAQNAGVSLYPNPANDIVNLSVSGVPAAPGQLEIYDMAGRELQQITGVRLGDGAGILQLGRSDMNLPGPGVYLIKITLGSQAYVRKLVITE